MTPYQRFIFYRTYSRWNGDRRETWDEAVKRYMSFMSENLGKKLSDGEYLEIGDAIQHMEVMPSMRLLWGAGDACKKSNATAYNCSFLAPTKLKDFSEILYLLTNGCGVGFSVEAQFVDQLPTIKKQTGKTLNHEVKDSREGWADALHLGLSCWYDGGDVEFDFSKVRPAGARLKTAGGRASGPEPLAGLLRFSREKILSRQEKKLRPIDVHDIVCKIGDVVVAGGVRRSSEISLSDLDDIEMRDAKKGAFYETEPQRSMANNSVAYNEKPSQAIFMREWMALMESGSGERGIFNRGGLHAQMPSRRFLVNEDHIPTMGTNPCGEINLRDKQFCNLTEVVARPEDTKKDLFRKMKIATILGTYQSSLTDFKYISKDWKRNCEEERLLGVSITGQSDCPKVRNPLLLRKLKEYSIEVNREYAKRFGINPSTSITCVKPSGTVSQLVDASSGLHPRFSKHYIRNVRISATDPLFKMLKDQGVPFHPEVGQLAGSAHTYVLQFPIKSPEGALTIDKTTALDQLEYWKIVKENFTEHNPSCTISVGQDEWLEVANWVWNNWEIIGGLSFLPKESHVYRLPPYQPITAQQYKKLVKSFPKIDFSKLTDYEKEDNTESEQALACVAGTCEI